MSMLTLQSNTVILPDETLDELSAALSAIDIRRPASYADTWGEPHLRDEVKSLTPHWTGEALITGSATQALMLALQYVGRTKVLALQVPCYFGVLRQAKELGMVVKPWQSVDELEGAGGFDAVILTSNLTPPHGLSLSDDDKNRVAALAEGSGAWVIEDNAYEPLWFYSPPRPISVDPALSIRIGSLSKVVSPDFRVGFVRAAGPTLEALRARKITMELSTPRFVQEVARVGITERALDRWRNELKSRSDTLRAAVMEAFDIEVARPDGGPYIALPIPDAADLTPLVSCCREGGLLIDDNRHHYPDTQNRPHVRLHAGSIRTEEIARAIGILKVSFDTLTQ